MMNRAFEVLTGQRILLTGGTGFFGTSLLLRLRDWREDALRNGVPCRMPRVVALSRNPKRFLARFPAFARLDFVEWIAADVQDFATPPGGFDFIIHAACPVRSVPGMREEILRGAERVLAVAEDCGVKRILFASSGAVYGAWNGPENIPDDAPCRPQTEFGRAKLEAESLFAAGRVPALRARCFSFAGFHLPCDRGYAFADFLRDALRGGPIVVRGDGTPVRAWMHARDLADWLFALLAFGDPQTPYNIGSSSPASIADLAETMRRIFRLPSDAVRILGEAEPRSDAAHWYVPRTERAESLGLRVTIPFEEEIRLSAIDPLRP